MNKNRTNNTFSIKDLTFLKHFCRGKKISNCHTREHQKGAKMRQKSSERCFCELEQMLNEGRRKKNWVRVKEFCKPL